MTASKLQRALAPAGAERAAALIGIFEHPMIYLYSLIGTGGRNRGAVSFKSGELQVEEWSIMIVSGRRRRAT
jgi:hypothetical protein